MKRVAQRKRRSGKPPLNFVLSTFPVELRRKRILRIVCTNDTEPHTKFRNRADIWYTNYVGVHPLHPTNEIHGWGSKPKLFGTMENPNPNVFCLKPNVGDSFLYLAKHSIDRQQTISSILVLDSSLSLA